MPRRGPATRRLALSAIGISLLLTVVALGAAQQPGPTATQFALLRRDPVDPARVSLILVNTRSEADEIAAGLAAGRRFAVQAAAHSTHPTAADDGALDPETLRALPDALCAVIASLKPGETRGPIEIPRLEGRAARARPVPGTAVGTLLDYFTGEPLSNVHVSVAADCQASGEIGSQNSRATGSDGRFRVALPPGASACLQILERRDLVRDAKLFPVNVGPRQEDDVLEIGEVLGHGTLDEEFAPVCDGARPVATPRGKAVVFFRVEGGWQSRYEYPFFGELHRASPWQGVMCIEEEKTVDHLFWDNARATRVTWKTRLIRLSDMKTFKTTVSDAPPILRPQEFPSGDVLGDPRKALLRWVAGLR
jgi:hypothetical protein